MKKEIIVTIDSEGLLGSMSVKCIVDKDVEDMETSFTIEKIIDVWFDVFDKVSHNMTDFFYANKTLLERLENLVIEEIENNELKYFDKYEVAA